MIDLQRNLFYKRSVAIQSKENNNENRISSFGLASVYAVSFFERPFYRIINWKKTEYTYNCVFIDHIFSGYSKQLR